jgi:CelD/BcsL family acetyltransferase involved in cellulose biosynthesis
VEAAAESLSYQKFEALQAAPVSVTAEPAAELSPRLRDAWADLAAAASEPNAFLEPWFMEASLRHLGPPADLKIAGVWSGGRLIGLIALHGASRYGRMPVNHLQNWTHYHCFLGTPLVRAEHEQDFWSALLRFLDAAPWANGFLHVKALVEGGPVHRGLAAARRCDTVHRMERAFLMSDLSPEAYYEGTVRKKKRKELKRLASRLAELGAVEVRTLSSPDELGPWCDAFLELEKSGWKGERGSALACEPGTAAFLREAVAGAFAAVRLDFLRLDLDGRPLAMLINFITPPGSFSFKIAIDEEFARFSPGVLIQLENLRILAREGIGWMDSCAAENHPMINSLWGERRPLVRVTVPLSGTVRGAAFRLCRFAEETSANIRELRR